MASSNNPLSAEEFEAASEILESLIDDYRAIHDFASRERPSERAKQFLPTGVLDECLYRIRLACNNTFTIVERYEGLIDELMSPNELRHSNCGTFAANYHGLLMAILLDFRWRVISWAYLSGDGASPFDGKRIEFREKHHKEFMEKYHPTSPYHQKSPEELAEMEETINLGDFMGKLGDDAWGRVIEKFAKKPLLEHREILAGIAMERGRVLKHLRQQEQTAGGQFDNQSNGKEATVQKDPCDPLGDAERDNTLQQNASTGWHESADTPPKDFPHGPLTGTKKQLAKWIIKETSGRRTLNKQMKQGTYWGRKNTATSWSVWFSTQARFEECNARKSKSEAAVNS